MSRLLGHTVYQAKRQLDLCIVYYQATVVLNIDFFLLMSNVFNILIQLVQTKQLYEQGCWVYEMLKPVCGDLVLVVLPGTPSSWTFKDSHWKPCSKSLYSKSYDLKLFCVIMIYEFSYSLPYSWVFFSELRKKEH